MRSSASPSAKVAEPSAPASSPRSPPSARFWGRRPTQGKTSGWGAGFRFAGRLDDRPIRPPELITGQLMLITGQLMLITGQLMLITGQLIKSALRAFNEACLGLPFLGHGGKLNDGQPEYPHPAQGVRSPRAGQQHEGDREHRQAHGCQGPRTDPAAHSYRTVHREPLAACRQEKP